MVVHQMTHEELWVSSGYAIYRSLDDGVTFNRVSDLDVSPATRFLGKFRLLSRALRLGVRCLRKLKSGTVLVVADRKVFRLRGDEGEVVHSFIRGLGPLREGVCEDDKGNCYIGEYFLNDKRKISVNLYKSVDDGCCWEIVNSFNNIRHIHCVQYDPFSGMIWMGTGDRDRECGIFFSDGGESWIGIGSGSQIFRTMSLLFTEDYIYWGMDAPSRQSYICRYARKDRKIELLAPVNGPVYYSSILDNGIMLFSTGAEGKSEGKSAAWDNRAHIWASLDGAKWEDVVSWEKDSWPHIFGHGGILFAHGWKDRLLGFTTQCLKDSDHASFIGYLSYHE